MWRGIQKTDGETCKGRDGQLKSGQLLNITRIFPQDLRSFAPESRRPWLLKRGSILILRVDPQLEEWEGCNRSPCTFPKIKGTIWKGPGYIPLMISYITEHPSPSFIPKQQDEGHHPFVYRPHWPASSVIRRARRELFAHGYAVFGQCLYTKKDRSGSPA